MRLFRFLLLCTFLIYLCALFYSSSSSVNALESKNKGVGKVKCKEQVNEALRQYFDKDGDGIPDDEDDDDESEEQDESTEVNTNEVDVDDDDDDKESGEDKVNSEEEEDATESEEDSKEEADKDDDKDDDDDDSEESNDASKEKSEEDEDDDDDDDSKEGNAAKVRAKKNAPAKKVEDDDDDDDDDDDSEEEEAEAAKPVNTPLKGANAAPAVSKKETKKESAKPKSSPKSAKKPVKKEEDDEDKEVSEEELLKQQHQQKRSRTHIDDILQVYEIGSQDDNLEQNLILSIFRDLKRIYEQTVKPLETIYKYRQITTRLITDSEIFSKPMVLFLGGKSTGKSSLVNYLLGIDDTPWEIKIGAASQAKFTILSYGENYTHLSPTELSADYTFSSLQRFGEQFLNEYIDAHRLPINILQKMTIVDSPGLIDLLPAKTAKQTIDNDVYQWFIDRSDVIYIVIDVSQLHLSSSLRALLDQLKGREVRFVISKSDIASHSQIISMFGQLLWVLSPIMSAEQPPMVYALTTLPQEGFDEFLDVQEASWLKDLSYELSGISRIDSHIAEIRRHAVRVRNHAKLVDCYLSTFYRNKGLFTFGASSRQLAADISENPHQYRIYSGAFMGQLQNVSRYDLPDPGVYREFFRSNPLIDFKPLSSTCSYFRGCPIDKLDVAIAYDFPELLGKYRKLTKVKLDQN